MRMDGCCFSPATYIKMYFRTDAKYITARRGVFDIILVINSAVNIVIKFRC